MIAAGGAELDVRRTGSGRPLLLINGLGADMGMWDGLAAELPGRELIAFDQPGLGRSTQLPRRLRMAGLADVVAELMDGLELERADVLGYSFGGLLAQELALRHPGRVERLVLAGTGPGVPAKGPPPRLALMLMSGRHTRSLEDAERLLPLVAGGRTARDPEVRRRIAEHRVSQAPDRVAVRRQLYASLGWSAQRRLPKLAAPTLVVQGTEDPLIHLSNTRRFERLIPDVRVELIEGAGHLVLVDEPERAAPAIRAFLDDGR